MSARLRDRVPERWRDTLLPAVIAVVGVAEVAALNVTRWPVAAVVMVLACTALIWRRRWPFAVGTLSAIAVLGIPLIGPRIDEASTPVVIALLASFTLGRYCGRLGLLGAVAILAVIALNFAVDLQPHGGGDALFVVALFFPPYILGHLVRRLAAQSAQLLEQQAWIERESARAERLRIARELHDVLAHSLSAMVVQTTAARDLVRTDPDHVERALDSVADAGRGALAETGRLLHILRDDEDELALRPAPRLAQLGSLIDGFRARGLRVEADLGVALAEEPDVPPAVNVSAYRIVQECLTNALRHSTDGSATLGIIRSPGRLCIMVTNPCLEESVPRPNGVDRGDGLTGTGLDSGRLGLAGMAERVALLGGTLERHVDAGRHVIRASLCWDDALTKVALP